MILKAAFAAFLFATASLAAAPEAPFTDIETISDAVFSPSRVRELRLTQPTSRELKAIQFARESLARQIQAAGPAWFSAVSDSAHPSAGDVRQVLDTLSRVPVMVCGAGCSACKTPGCSLTKPYGNTFAAMLVVHACTLSSSPRACKSLGLQYNTPNVRLLFEGIRNSYTEIAWTKYHPVLNYPERAAALRKATAALAESTQIMAQIADACPGPFPEKGFRFLTANGHLREIGGFADECAKKYLAPFKTAALPASCKSLIDAKAWDTFVSKGLAWNEPLSMRCDGTCELLTCGEKENPRVRGFKMGTRWILSLPEGACEGSIPIRPRELVETLVRSAGNTAALRRPSSVNQIDSCARALVPKVEVVPSQQNVDVSGPTIDLIE